MKPENKKQKTLLDLAVIVFFIVFSVMYYYGTMESLEKLGRFSLGGDGGRIAGFAAALDDNVRFAGDGILADTNDFGFYTTIHIPLIQFINQYTNSYSEAFMFLLGPHVFLHLAGFYLLGVLLLKSRMLGILLSLLCFINISTEFSTYWGISHVTLPRVSFSAVAGFYIAAAFYWRKEYRVWPWLMGATGLLMYIHPVSAPTFALALWFGFWGYRIPDWSLRNRTLYLIFSGACFLAVALPFIFNYMSLHEVNTSTNVGYINMIRSKIIVGDIIDYLQALYTLLVRLLVEIPLIPMAILGAWLIFYKGRQEERSIAKLFGLWMAGVVASSVVVHSISIESAKLFDVTPVQVELVRGIRLLIPFLICFILWSSICFLSSFRAFSKYWPKLRGILGSISIVMLVWILRWSDFLPVLLNTETILLKVTGQPEKIIPTHPRAEFIAAIPVHTPPKSIIFLYSITSSVEQAVRHTALRPVSYSRGDATVLYYGNQEKLIRWFETLKSFGKAGISDPGEMTVRERTINLLKDARERFSTFIAYPKVEEIYGELDHDYLAGQGVVVWSNEEYVLFRLQEVAPIFRTGGQG
jgi:hypothetical protein